MRRCLLAVGLILVSSEVSWAGPITWPWVVRFQPADAAENILLGSEYWSQSSEGPSKEYFLYYDIGSFGTSRLGFLTEPGTVELFSFGHGWWGITEVRPDPAITSDHAFELWWGFSEGEEYQVGLDRGHASVTGVFVTGTGNTWLELDESHDIRLGDNQARVRFYTENHESVSRIMMSVSDLGPVSTPEPATVLLAGVGLAGVGVWRRFR